MRMEKIISCILVMVLLASAVPLAVTPASASPAGTSWLPWETGKDEVPKGELASAICSYMLGESAISLEDLRDAAFIFAYWTPETTGDYTLGIICGNANEDDTIDVRDLIYIREVIAGKKPATKLADAKYDGKINPLDVEQTKLIIVGKEKEITVIDMNGRTVTVPKPIERLVVTHREQFEQLRSLKVPKDIILTAERQILTTVEYKIYFAEFQHLPDVGSGSDPNVEAIVGLRPDAILMGSYGQNTPQHTAALEVFKSVGIALIYVHENETNFVENLRLLGYIFGKKDEAEEYIDWRKDLWNSIKERVENIPDKPKVYIEWAGRYKTAKEADTRIAAMGGRCIFEGKVSGDVNPEEVAKRNPDIIIITGGGGKDSGYITNDVTGLKELREELMSREELQHVSAVKTGKVYVMSYYITGWAMAWRQRFRSGSVSSKVVQSYLL